MSKQFLVDHWWRPPRQSFVAVVVIVVVVSILGHFLTAFSLEALLFNVVVKKKKIAVNDLESADTQTKARGKLPQLSEGKLERERREL